MLIIITLLACMSLCGTIPFFIYLLLIKLFDNKLCAALRYCLLKICLACYLLPFPLVKHLALRLFQTHPSVPQDGTYLYMDRLIVQDNGYFFIPHIPAVHKFLLGIWIILILFIILNQILKYLHFYRHIFKNLTADSQYGALLQCLRKELHIRRTISIRHTTAQTPPFTCGWIRPMVILPISIPEPEAAFILRHELQHIKSFDFLFRLCAFSAVLLHCCNPVAYLFWKEWKEVQELHCDESAIKRFDRQNRKAYGLALIQAAVQPSPPAGNTGQPALYFSTNSQQFLKKRVIKIAHPVKQSRLLAFLFLCLTAGAAILPAAAYSPAVYDQKDLFCSKNELGRIDWIRFSKNFINVDDILKGKTVTQATDDYHILKDGAIILHPNTQGIPGNAGTMGPCQSCGHPLAKNVQMAEHATRYADCSICIYNLSQCTKCGQVDCILLTQEITPKPCKHPSQQP